MREHNDNAQQRLGTAPVGSLIFRYAIPSVMSFIVSSAYNITDQIFIGHGVGMLGNAATNVAFPISTICTALALLLGVGSAANFNLELGRGNKERAASIAGNGITAMLAGGVAVAVLVIVFLSPLMRLFGATPNVMPLALTYTHITAFGIPFAVFTTAFCQLIRSDGSPVYAMVCIMSGAVLNTLLDPLFIFTFDMGIAGAAWATVISQAVSAVMAATYLSRFKSVRLGRSCFVPERRLIGAVCALGAAASFNQLALLVVQITMNNTLTYYGGMSVYGSDIPLAVVGVISKVNAVLMAFTIGIAHGTQPVVGYNYGARNYGRVRTAYKISVVAATILCGVAFLCFQLFPRQITSIFGSGEEMYFHFAERYLRVFMFFTFLNGFQILSSNFFTYIGKAKKGILLSLTRQVMFLLPLILVLPLFSGLDGVVYAGPVADIAAVILAAVLIIREFRVMKTLEPR